MPFFDDSGPKPEEEHEPFGRTFALIKEQLERMVALNLLWAAQSFPFLLAWAFPMPDILRIALSLYTALAIPAATGSILGVLHYVSRGEPLSMNLLQDCFRDYAKVGLFKLMPLYSLFFFLAALANLAAEQNWLILDVMLRLGMLFLLAAALYWGAILASQPDLPLQQVLQDSIRLFWRDPAQSLLLLLSSAFFLLLGMISVAGMILIVPILLIMLQIEFYQAMQRENTVERKDHDIA